MMNPLFVRILIFLALVVTAMLIIIGVASVSHAGECLPSARAVWNAHNGKHATWNMVGGQKCYRVGYGRHHQKVMQLAGHRGRRFGTNDVRPRSAYSPTVRWQNPGHAKLFEEFEDWLYLGKR